MKIQVNEVGNDKARVVNATISGEIILSKVFNGVGIRTEEGNLFGVCQRDSGLEIVCPDGTLVGVKVYEGGETVCHGLAAQAYRATNGEAFVERNGKVIG